MSQNLTPAARKARTARNTSRVVFGTGLVVSLAANVVASDHSVLGVASGLWAPLAFLLAMLMMENVPAKGAAGKARLVAMLFLALVAGWNSYWHLVEVFQMGGSDTLSAHLMPLTVDVMMALASPGMKTKTTSPARRRPAAKKAPVKVAKLRAV
jgi:hypothetical protein